MMNKIVSLLLSLLLLSGLLCPAAQPASAAESVLDNENDAPLVVGCNSFTGKFNPFYTENTTDETVTSLTGLNLLTIDRTGAIVLNAIEGEMIPYDGTDYTYTGPADLSVNYDGQNDVTVYTAKLRDDLKFWDGEPVTAKDLLFTYYVFLDPTYTGKNVLKSFDVIGLRSWYTQTTDAIYEKYEAIAFDILADGHWDGYEENDQYTEEMYADFWSFVDEQWEYTVQCICNYCEDHYLNNDYEFIATGYVGKSVEEILADDRLKIAFGMACWGFARVDEDGMFRDTRDAQMSWDLVQSFPTLDDYVTLTKIAYDYDPVSFFNTEQTGTEGSSVVDYAVRRFIETYGCLEMNGEQINSIEGIRMLDDYTVEITITGYSSAAVYQIFGITIAPMHYYGDPDMWDPDNGLYGFDRCDLDRVNSLSSVPRGAGPYIFESFEEGVVTFRANPYWYRGEPKIKTVQFKDMSYFNCIDAIVNGDADVCERGGSPYLFESIADSNTNGKLTGNLITTVKYDYSGYGYIGINADTVNINGDADSDASKALRKALATIISVYREAAYQEYFGESASVIEYPISNTSWAAPQPSDPGYRAAFSVDASGKDIYTAGMSANQKYAAAKAAALTWFQAAGYTVQNGIVVNGPKMSFEAMVPGNGCGDHPSFKVLTMARDALASIGIELIINDLMDSSVLWESLDYGTQELWCAAWSSTIDPDMFQIYHSGNIAGMGGTDSNHYHIRDEELDELIMEARNSIDQSFRKSLYRQCLDIIGDWAVEIPGYQRQNCYLFSTKRVNTDTLTPDITTYWSWTSEIEKLEMGGTKIVFSDVPEGAFYAKAVEWAVENDITTGTSDTTFSPKKTCTRGQVVTFLWRAAGCPKPRQTSHDFTDVNENAYYYKAMLWAVEQGITTGTSSTTFSPNKDCTRVQVVTFLWRFFGCPDHSLTENPFTDVKAANLPAVLWAVEHNITQGTNATTFSPSNPCNRGQVVTFLYRAVNQQ